MSSREATPRSLGKILRFKREQAGLTLSEVGRQLGDRGVPCSRSTLNGIESGAAPADANGMHGLLRLFEIPTSLISDLLDLESRGIEIPEPADFDTMFDRANASWFDGDPDRGMAWFIALQHLCTDADPYSERMQHATLCLAQGISRDGRLAPARRILDSVLRVGVHPNLRVRTYVYASMLWRYSGNLDVAAAFLERAAEATRPGNREAYAWTMHERALLDLARGRLDEAERSLDNALRHYAETDRTRNRLACQLMRVRILRASDREAEALQVARDVLKGAREHGFDRMASSASIQIARCLIASGRAEEAVERLNAEQEDARRRGHASQIFDARANLWRAYRALGDEQRAREALEAAGALAEILEFCEPDVVEVREALEELRGQATERAPRTSER